MQTRHAPKINKDNSFTMHPALIVKLHISPTLQTEISLTPDSDIDSVIHQCIVKYKLKKEAHPFLKQQIMKFISKSKSVKKIASESFQYDHELVSNFNKNPLGKNQMILKDLKAGDIDRNKVSIQRTPKNQLNLLLKKETKQTVSKTNKFITETPNNPKIYLKKKKENEKQNSLNYSLGNTSFLEQKNHKTHSTNPVALFPQKNEQSKKNSKQNSLANKNLCQIEKQISIFLERGVPLQQKNHRKIKTVENQLDTSMRMKQFSLKDLQNEMNEQVVDLKFQKRVKNLQSQLSNLFNSIIRYNPPKINKIDPRYACFQDLDQKVIQALHEFLIQLKDDELNSLDFTNFKTLIVKYRGDVLLSSLK